MIFSLNPYLPASKLFLEIINMIKKHLIEKNFD